MGPGERGHRHFDDPVEESTYSVQASGRQREGSASPPTRVPPSVLRCSRRANPVVAGWTRVAREAVQGSREQARPLDGLVVPVRGPGAGRYGQWRSDPEGCLAATYGLQRLLQESRERPRERTKEIGLGSGRIPDDFVSLARHPPNRSECCLRHHKFGEPESRPKLRKCLAGQSCGRILT